MSSGRKIHFVWVNCKCNSPPHWFSSGNPILAFGFHDDRARLSMNTLLSSLLQKFLVTPLLVTGIHTYLITVIDCRCGQQEQRAPRTSGETVPWTLWDTSAMEHQLEVRHLHFFPALATKILFLFQLSCKVIHTATLLKMWVCLSTSGTLVPSRVENVAVPFADWLLLYK